jgi:hypothetical protein
MIIVPQEDDAPEFTNILEGVVSGIARRHLPQTLVLIKIDNWFGRAWRGFQGKVLGAMGTWSIPRWDVPPDHLVIPPFVPNRVVSQRRFNAPDYQEVDRGKPIHKNIPSDLACERRVSNEIPNTAIVWYSGNSKLAGRGSVMAYIPASGSYWAWYAGWKKWGPSEQHGITRAQLLQLIEEGHLTSYL